MEQQGNPYGAPVPGTGEPGLGPTGVGAPGAVGGWMPWSIGGTVQTLTKWMRFVAVVQFILGGLLVVGGVAVLMLAGRLPLPGILGASLWIVGVGLAVIAAVVILGGAFLLRAGTAWRRSQTGGQAPLAAGFRHFRTYLIVYVVFTVLGLVGELAMQFVGTGG